MRITRFGLAGTVILISVLTGTVMPAGAAGALACRTDLVASIRPALQGYNPGEGGIRLRGTMTDCSPEQDSRGAANVSAGYVYTDANGFEWLEPEGTISGSCISNGTTATTINRWQDGGISITSYASESFTYGIAVAGTNIASVKLYATNPKPGQPPTLTVNATRDVGMVMSGMLFASDMSDPYNSSYAAFIACSGTGLTTTPLSGFESFAG